MKIYTMVLALVAAAPAVAASGYNYNTTGSNNGYYTSQRSNNKTTTMRSRSTSSYNNADSTKQNYYGTYYNETGSGNSGYVTREKQVTTRTYSSQERKYFLAHPFFQPLKGKFGSVTDFAYATNNFKFDVLNANWQDIDSASPSYGTIVSGLADLKGKAETTQFLVKEDFSFGLSDTLAVIGMLQYDSTKTSFKDWSTGAPNDSYSDSGLNLFGIGLQSRFVDEDNWIAMIAGYYQHQKDTANTFIGELKAGYKIERTTVYGLLRGGYSDLTKGDVYGAYIKDGDDWMMLSYKTDLKNIIYVEGGVGAFAVLNKYLTLNGELVYGHYDWHNQLNIKGAFGWQPADMFALNLYASASLYDSAKGKENKFMSYDVNPDTASLPAAISTSTLVYTTGDYKLKDYNEWKIGVQAILYF